MGSSQLIDELSAKEEDFEVKSQRAEWPRVCRSRARRQVNTQDAALAAANGARLRQLCTKAIAALTSSAKQVRARARADGRTDCRRFSRRQLAQVPPPLRHIAMRLHADVGGARRAAAFCASTRDVGCSSCPMHAARYPDAARSAVGG